MTYLTTGDADDARQTLSLAGPRRPDPGTAAPTTRKDPVGTWNLEPGAPARQPDPASARRTEP